MKKVIRLTESDLVRLVKRAINESEKKLSSKWYGVNLDEVSNILKNDYGWDGRLTQELVRNYENSVIFNKFDVAYKVTDEKYAKYLYKFINDDYQKQMPKEEEKPWRGNVHDNPYGPHGDWGQHATTAWG